MLSVACLILYVNVAENIKYVLYFLSLYNCILWNFTLVLILRYWLFLQHGYAVIDLQILCPSEIEDICLMKFLSLVLQVPSDLILDFILFEPLFACGYSSSHNSVLNFYCFSLFRKDRVK